MISRRVCKDCEAEGIPLTRSAPHPGPRCATHHRERKKTLSTQRWEQHIQKTYGITSSEYWAIYEAQGGVCAICQRANGKVRRLAVDHDHKTGMIRGALCRTCNRQILGHSRDEIEFFERAAQYLRYPPAVSVIGERIAPE